MFNPVDTGRAARSRGTRVRALGAAAMGNAGALSEFSGSRNARTRQDALRLAFWGSRGTRVAKFAIPR